MIDKKRIKRYSVLQHDSSDCGVACLVSIINFYGGSVTNENIRRLSGTTQSGTTMLGLLQAAKQNGLDASGYEASVSEIINFDGVLIMHIVTNTNLEHYIVNFGYENERFIIWDPSKGIELISKEELEEIWISKKCLGLKTTASFKYSNEKKKEKSNWLIKNIDQDSSLLITTIVLGIVISVLSLVMALYTQKLIDKILPAKDIKVLVISLVLVFFLLTARIILNIIRQSVLLKQGQSFNTRIVDNFFRALLLLPKTFFDTRKTGDFIARLNDTIRIQKVIAEFAGGYIIDLIIIVVSMISMFLYSKITAIITICILPAFFLLVYRWN